MVKINGINTEASGMTISQYLETTDFNRTRIAVECNGNIVPKGQYDSTTLRDGDTVEIVGFVGGG